MSSSEQTPSPADWLHFAGVGGSGMSALAVFHAMTGGTATGSDRVFDRDQLPALRANLERAGVILVSQDGTFDACGPPHVPCAGVVVSTAVEDRVPDIARARQLGLPVLHRSELLARHVASHRTIAVSGTSGKSTVTAMIFAILDGCGRGPGLLTGGALAQLTSTGHLGNAWAPARPETSTEPPLLVIEADESDGSLVRYHPWIGLVLNLGLDHKPPAEVFDMFSTFRRNVQDMFVVADESNLAELHDGAHLFGLGPAARPGTWADDVNLQPDGSRFTIDGTAFTLRQPGIYNVRNAVAAVAACRLAGVSVADAVEPLATFAGVARRFQSVGRAGGVEVIDDFAHNPDKILASLAAGRDRLATHPGGRILAVFQPHGFGPTRFLRTALADAFAAGLEPADVLWMPEIYFAGGTITRDISSADLVADVVRGGRNARFLAERDTLPVAVAAEARPGDLVLVMGARDPSLTDFCRDIVTALRNHGDRAGDPEMS